MKEEYNVFIYSFIFPLSFYFFFQSSMTFTEDSISENVFSVEEYTFFYVNSFGVSLVVHVQMFKKYGETYYPKFEAI